MSLLREQELDNDNQSRSKVPAFSDIDNMHVHHSTGCITLVHSCHYNIIIIVLFPNINCLVMFAVFSPLF